MPPKECVALYLQSPTSLGGVHMDYECVDAREQVTGGQRNLQSVELKTVLRRCYYHNKQ
jgi:hypothetical protein